MKSRTLSLGVALATLFLTACSGLLPKATPFDVYRLPVPAATASSATGVTWQLRIDTPDAPRALAGPRINVIHDGTRVSVYAGARWAEAVPQLVRDRLIAAFRTDGRVPMVSSDDDDLGADFTLGSHLDAFQAEYASAPAPAVTVRLDAWLLPNGASKPVANHRFAVTVPATGSAVPDVVSAFGKASDELAADVIAWTLANAKRATP